MMNLSITNSDMTRVVKKDNGDGTGTHTVLDADGNVTLTEALTDLPIPEPPEPTAEEELADMRSTIAQQTALLAALFGTDDQATLDAEVDAEPDEQDGDI